MKGLVRFDFDPFNLIDFFIFCISKPAYKGENAKYFYEDYYNFYEIQYHFYEFY